MQPDPIYGSRLVNLLIARILQSGKKSVAQRVVYTALEIITSKTEENPILICPSKHVQWRTGLGRSHI